MTMTENELWQRKNTASPGGTPPGQTITQAHLARICNPTTLCSEAHFDWVLRTRDPNRYPAPDLAERLAELDPEIESLAATIHAPPWDWTAAQWTKAHDRLDRLRGQRLAIRQTLASRNAAGWSPPSARSIARDVPDLIHDPFDDRKQPTLSL